MQCIENLRFKTIVSTRAYSPTHSFFEASSRPVRASGSALRSGTAFTAIARFRQIARACKAVNELPIGIHGGQALVKLESPGHASTLTTIYNSGIANMPLPSITDKWGRAAVTFLLSLLVACATPVPVSISISLLHPELGSLDDGAVVMPGSVVSVEAVQVTDSTGATRPLSDDEQYAVVVEGGTFSPQTGDIYLQADRNLVPDDGYSVRVTLKDGPTRVISLLPDFAGLYGPEPQDVAAVGVSLVWLEDDTPVTLTESTPLIPGEQYFLRVSVTDVDGRVFVRSHDERSLPLERLNVNFTNFRSDDDDWSRLKASLLPQGESFGLEVSYDGAAQELVRRLEFPVDDAIAYGPEPGEVARIELLGELAEQTSITPGAEIALEVRVTDFRGRQWVFNRDEGNSHLENRFVLPKSRLTVEVSHGRYASLPGQILFDADLPGMIGREYSLEVTYGFTEELRVARSYAPDFLAIVPLMDTDELVYQGRPGRSGRHGQDGQDGTRGSDSGSEFGRGGSGRSGGRGTDGQMGARGAPGPLVRVVAREVRTLDAAHRLVLLEVRTPGALPEYYVRRMDALPLTVISRGGKGGDGGNGGNGGKGGDGGDGFFSGDGGDGGDAGSGGDGGNGGDGGDVDLILASYDMEPLFLADSQGGEPGIGGTEGVAGQPGIPGSIEDWMAEQRARDGMQPEAGTYGNEGNIGRGGRMGFAGLAGTIEFQIDEEQAAALVRRAPEHIRSVVLF